MNSDILELEVSAWNDKSILLQMEPWGMFYDIPPRKIYLVQLKDYESERSKLHIRWHEEGIFIYANYYRLFDASEKGQEPTLIDDIYWT